MKKLSLNPEYARRHVFAALVTLALAFWFAYDGFISYPATPAAELYKMIEKADAPATVDLEAFKKQKIGSQLGFAALSFLASLIVSLRLLSSARFNFSYGSDAFLWKGKNYTFSDIKEVDFTRWSTKGIARLILNDGVNITLDSWHHLSVGDFIKALPERFAKA